jgi:hypothetical protein
MRRCALTSISSTSASWVPANSTSPPGRGVGSKPGKSPPAAWRAGGQAESGHDPVDHAADRAGAQHQRSSGSTPGSRSTARTSRQTPAGADRESGLGSSPVRPSGDLRVVAPARVRTGGASRPFQIDEPPAHGATSTAWPCVFSSIGSRWVRVANSRSNGLGEGDDASADLPATASRTSALLTRRKVAQGRKRVRRSRPPSPGA